MHCQIKIDCFPTCQVRVVRFYVSLLLPSSSFLPPFVAIIVFFNREPHVFSARCQTSTASLCVQCSPQDLYGEQPRPMFPARPRSSLYGQYSLLKIRAHTLDEWPYISDSTWPSILLSRGSLVVCLPFNGAAEQKHGRKKATNAMFETMIGPISWVDSLFIWSLLHGCSCCWCYQVTVRVLKRARHELKKYFQHSFPIYLLTCFLTFCLTYLFDILSCTRDHCST